MAMSVASPEPEDFFGAGFSSASSLSSDFSSFSSGSSDLSSSLSESSEAGAASASPTRAITSPTSTVSSSSARISSRVPETGEGTSVSTLSVETSSSGSSSSTVSPTFFSHWVMVPSVMDSPSSGMAMSVASPEPADFFGAGFSSASSLSSDFSSFGSSFSSALPESSEPEGSSPSSPSSPMTAMTSPTSTVSSSSALISSRTPAAGDGISVSTLSVETSSSGSSSATVSPTFFSHWVMVPSVTDSPSSGISTENAMFCQTPRKVVWFML